MKKVTLTPALKSAKTLIEATSRFTLGQVSIEVENDHLIVIPTKTDTFGATELCGLLQHPINGYFVVRDEKVVLMIYSME